MTRETIEHKARRLLQAGGVKPLPARSRSARVGHVDGDNGHYLVTVMSSGEFSCTCETPNFRLCSHTAALLLAVGDKRFTRAIARANERRETN